MIDEADLIFMPYNYILSENITNSVYSGKENEEKKTMKEIFKNAVLLIDEAHNLVSSCEEAHGFVINTDEINDVVKELEYFKNKVVSNKFEDFEGIERI